MMNLAISSPDALRYSETFIQMQMERLPCVFRIYGSPVATETVPGGVIQPMKSLRGLMDLAVECGLKGKRWEGPQARELARRLRHRQVDTLLANYGPHGVALAPVCEELGLRLFVHFHGHDAHKQEMVEANGANYRRLGQQAAGIIVVSERMREAVAGFGIPSEKIHLARCGVDAGRFQEKAGFPSSPLFFGVGRFVDKKAPYLTVLAFKTVHERFPQARLILGGTGELLEATQNLAVCLGLGDAVVFPGILKHDEVAAHMQQATAYVQHSITPLAGPAKGDSEGTPVAVLEALVTGLPVISTRHAGIGEVIRDGETGFLVEERDTAAMAAAMLRVAGDPELARRLGQQGRREALEKHTATHYIDRLKEIMKI